MKRALTILAAMALTATIACDKSEGEGASTSSAAASADKADEGDKGDKGDKSGADEGGGEKKDIDLEAAKAAYNDTFGNMDRSKDAWDDKFKDFKAKMGAPHKTDGDDYLWYVGDDKWCYEFKAMKGKGASMLTTDKEKCK